MTKNRQKIGIGGKTMKGKISSHYGEVQISEEVVASYAGNAAVSCFGIVGMAAVPISGKGLAKLLKQESYHKGISVDIQGNEISLDFHVIVAYGVSIQAVAENLMESVRYRISQFTGMKVRRINVYVEGVRVID